jgi:hypothetical protein
MPGRRSSTGEGFSCAQNSSNTHPCGERPHGHQQVLTSRSLGKDLGSSWTGQRLQSIGGRSILCLRQGNLALGCDGYCPQPFSPVECVAETFRKRIFGTLDLHIKGAPRPRKGIIPPCSGVRPYNHSLLPDAADHGRPRRSESCLYANYPRAPTLNT